MPFPKDLMNRNQSTVPPKQRRNLNFRFPSLSLFFPWIQAITILERLTSIAVLDSGNWKELEVKESDVLLSKNALGSGTLEKKSNILVTDSFFCTNA